MEATRFSSDEEIHIDSCTDGPVVESLDHFFPDRNLPRPHRGLTNTLAKRERVFVRLIDVA